MSQRTSDEQYWVGGFTAMFYALAVLFLATELLALGIFALFNAAAAALARRTELKASEG